MNPSPEYAGGKGPDGDKAPLPCMEGPPKLKTKDGHCPPALKPYDDGAKKPNPKDPKKPLPADNCTVGYGHVIHYHPCGKGETQEEKDREKYYQDRYEASIDDDAERDKYTDELNDLFKGPRKEGKPDKEQSDLERTASEVRKRFKNTPLSQVQFDGWVDIAFNDWGLFLRLLGKKRTDCLALTNEIDEYIEKKRSKGTILPGNIARRNFNKGLLCENCENYGFHP